MTLVSGFPPVSDARAKVLILGSMPGAASLAAGQYYAHPRNHFWRVMGDITGAGPETPYDKRLEILKKNRIALWDVLECCHRPGSLDSSITKERANDFAEFFRAHKNVARVFFNGTKAESLFMKLVLPKLPHLLPSPRKRGSLATDPEDPRFRGEGNRLIFTRLPSTSPANAGYSFEKKLKAWERILEI